MRYDAAAIMGSPFDIRRFLTDFDSLRIGHVLTDTLVIGSGVAGCRAALAAAEFGPVILITKAGFEDSCTHAAQGGIAVALGPDDDPQQHFEDTVRVGCGLSRHRAVERLVREAPERIRELIDWGMAFDRRGDDLDLGREGGHRTNRIVHARGDQTGRELSRTLKVRVETSSNIRVFPHCFLIDLLVLDGSCVGALTHHGHHGHQIIWAKQTILASGGCGRLWRETTNPPVATGDGAAVAFRAGAVLTDMEFMQFHPTTLYVAGSGRALISEAVRGEGAYLVDREGNRFMQAYHPDGELAPRDVVSRAIQTHLRKTRANCVYLDVRHLSGFAARFPHIASLCAQFQIDVTKDLIPVRPSAHYMIGGVRVDLKARTSIPG
ncbi:MAG: FAD-dependent oxidoreductase, partial [Planctomycetota bacterium]